MVVLRPAGLGWIDGTADDPEDLCAHAGVEFSVGRDVLLRPEDGRWTVSAAALYLLRTLTRDHTADQRVAEFLFPCCGNPMVAEEGESDVTIIGCDKGKNVWVRHDGEAVTVTAPDGRACHLKAWKKAVCGFADQVEAFYRSGAPKTFFEPAEEAGFRRFVEEWRRRRGRGFEWWR